MAFNEGFLKTAGLASSIRRMLGKKPSVKEQLMRMRMSVSENTQKYVDGHLTKIKEKGLKRAGKHYGKIESLSGSLKEAGAFKDMLANAAGKGIESMQSMSSPDLPPVKRNPKSLALAQKVFKKLQGKS